MLRLLHVTTQMDVSVGRSERNTDQRSRVTQYYADLRLTRL